MQAPQTTRHAAPRLPRLALRLTVAVALAALMSACGGGTNGPAADTTPPTVAAMSPPSSASAVPATTAVTATFSEPMDAATLTTATFTLQAAGAAVPGTVSVNGNAATFTPSTPLVGGTLYSAAVSTGVKDAAGNPLAAAQSWSFTTVATAVQRTWSAPVLLETADSSARSPAIAATLEDAPSIAAQATAVWVQSGSVYANRFRQGAWEGAVQVESHSTGEVFEPQVAMGAFGRAVMTWTYNNGNPGYSIWSNIYDGAFSMANARQVSSGAGNASDVHLSFDGSGDDVFTVWHEYDSSRQPAAYRIGQRRYLFVPCEFVVPCAWDPADFGWRDLSFVEIYASDASSPQVSAYGSGNAVAVWVQYGAGLRASTYTRAGGWAAAMRVNAASSTTARSPVVAAAADGTAVAVWIEFAAGRDALFASRLSSAGWSAPIAFDDSAAGAADTPQVVMDALGNATIVWAQGNVYARRCPSGALSACSTPVRIETLSGASEHPHLANASGGDAVVVWKLTDASVQRRIYATHYTAATSLWDPTPTLVGIGTALNEGPKVAMDKRGHATVVWTRDEAGKNNIYASRFE